MSDAARAIRPRKLAAPTGFRADERFAGGPIKERGFRDDNGAQPESEAHDPVATAYAEGFAAGAAETQVLAEDAARALAEARERLSISFQRLDSELEEQFTLRLREVIVALCESAIEPLALDEEQLVRRIERAVSMLARADDARVIRLHPDDIALVARDFHEDWTVEPDPILQRGALRVETATGGVEDGPSTWREAILEALQSC